MLKLPRKSLKPSVMLDRDAETNVNLVKVAGIFDLRRKTAASSQITIFVNIATIKNDKVWFAEKKW